MTAAAAAFGLLTTLALALAGFAGLCVAWDAAAGAVRRRRQRRYWQRRAWRNGRRFPR